MSTRQADAASQYETWVPDLHIEPAIVSSSGIEYTSHLDDRTEGTLSALNLYERPNGGLSAVLDSLASEPILT